MDVVSAGISAENSLPMDYPTLDAHAHLAPERPSRELEASGAVLAMTLFPQEATRAAEHQEPAIAWGIGCHPRFPEAQEGFDPQQFEELLQKTALVGEIGLDSGSRVPMVRQLENFRLMLEAISSKFWKLCPFKPKFPKVFHQGSSRFNQGA